VFLFIGADPNTAWLEDCVAVDGKGFVVTGASASERPRPLLSLDTESLDTESLNTPRGDVT
jgi:thioredoxin reductase (NADPH)